MPKFKNYEGQKFGRLLVLQRAENKNKRVQWLCRCDCGKNIIVLAQSLKSGDTKSCGCLKKEQDKINLQTPIHNKTNTRLYNIWRDMKWRCNSPKNKRRKFYLDKNITVCDEWKNNFMNFYNWAINNGYNDNLSIDRINNNGNYEPSNCRWATYTEQNNNQSTSRRYLYKDKEYTLKELSKLSGIKLATLDQRINRYNWEVKKAVETKVQIKNTMVE